jgi:DNA processing protein
MQRHSNDSSYLMRTDPDQLRYLVGFTSVPGIGRVRLSLLQGYFGDLERAWMASMDELQSAGLDAKSARALVATRASVSLDDELAKLKQLDVKALSPDDPLFPPRLREVYDCPIMIYVRGTVIREDECAVAVVGTRHPSVYGRQAAEEITKELARNKVTIVSGLAAGIDAVAHRATLDAGGRTIAVCGCGLDMVYPSNHATLARQVMEHGALVSEFPLGTRPKAEHFPQRNRIISGMSLGVLVVEAGEESGALLTTNRALEQNRDVFAIPGSIFSPLSVGTNYLIQQGAKLIRNCEDILEELNLNMVPHQLEMRELVAPTDTEAQVLMHLTKEATHIDALCRISGLPTPTVTSTLAMLELKGLARQVGGMNYILN